MFDDFTTQVQSDENWVETLIHMENINRLLEEDIWPTGLVGDDVSPSS